MGDQHDGAFVAGEGDEHLGAAGGIEVVGRLVQQQHVGPRDHEGRQRQPRLLSAREGPDRLVDGVTREEEGPEDAACLGELEVGSGRP